MMNGNVVIPEVDALIYVVLSEAEKHVPYGEFFGTTACVGRDSSVGIPIRYGLDGPGIESRWRRDFPHPSRLALGPTQPPIQWVPGLSWG
jgi:hypothetical protein